MVISDVDPCGTDQRSCGAWFLQAQVYCSFFSEQSSCWVQMNVRGHEEWWPDLQKEQRWSVPRPRTGEGRASSPTSHLTVRIFSRRRGGEPGRRMWPSLAAIDHLNAPTYSYILSDKGGLMEPNELSADEVVELARRIAAKAALEHLKQYVSPGLYDLISEAVLEGRGPVPDPAG